MANNRRNADPAEGSQDTIERELQNRDEDNKPSTSPSQAEENRSGAADVKEQRVRRRAYEIWEREGGIDGDHERHWEQATSEIEEEERLGS
ncbi:DUF2934 domain-containing protein [Sinorhizobium meliloti]|uniref:DUF2934 domain-containing protein n=1 Tax=Rhizobium meliloti TaxID=382 RepID=UPI000FD70508|nr:DUF2934 domain-containing protein [Sinorhizobium meliloti]MDW9726619.1 DUF2934 domain-containing protein [Sinorhizobium meliloti]MDW9729177.1 DUF2934 domain-containing protein [Sinorhizobium meliloti]MDW9788910.1 DUF2934 domain-containing protein [Sinorhizobium meliloti]RVG27279.1 DUF2934 domain-containing protein [Sinorhizobium meliloti]